ncbi:hypothetical protein [Kaistia sp. 32K]|uniref:hypothetical protein n=1 Tax=Kaistia sp. 32K TaxID=2795690 RepID=UPI0019163D7A|nr:hypothetical protein [Kaistia sp. 32K]
MIIGDVVSEGMRSDPGSDRPCRGGLRSRGFVDPGRFQPVTTGSSEKFNYTIFHSRQAIRSPSASRISGHFQPIPQLDLPKTRRKTWISLGCDQLSQSFE